MVAERATAAGWLSPACHSRVRQNSHRALERRLSTESSSWASEELNLGPHAYQAANASHSTRISTPERHISFPPIEKEEPRASAITFADCFVCCVRSGAGSSRRLTPARRPLSSDPSPLR